MSPPPAGRSPDEIPVECADCRAALAAGGRESTAFLLADHLTVPVVGCDRHREELRAVCTLATAETAELFEHRPAGGIRCPACRLAGTGSQPVVSVADGGIAVIACPAHRSELLDRYRAGLETRRQLAAPSAPF